MKQAAENQEKAAMRGRCALEMEREQKAVVENKENAHIIARKCALELERVRTNKIIRMPKPPTEEQTAAATKPAGKQQLVSLHDANVFATTRYHMPECIVDKASEKEEVSATSTGRTAKTCTLRNLIHFTSFFKDQDAGKKAVVEESRQMQLKTDLNRSKQERMEKARLRGKHALEKEILTEVTI
jgi:hypothetical protein